MGLGIVALDLVRTCAGAGRVALNAAPAQKLPEVGLAAW